MLTTGVSGSCRAVSLVYDSEGACVLLELRTTRGKIAALFRTVVAVVVALHNQWMPPEAMTAPLRHTVSHLLRLSAAPLTARHSLMRCRVLLSGVSSLPVACDCP